MGRIFTQNLNNEHLDKYVDFDKGDGAGGREVCKPHHGDKGLLPHLGQNLISDWRCSAL